MSTPPFNQVTNINSLRTGSGFTINEIYYTNDLGQEGFWRYVGDDYVTLDNTGLILTNPEINNNPLPPAPPINRGIFKRIFDEYICVDWFGAKGDYLTDNTTAIQLAVNTMLKASYGTLYFKAGNYLTNAIDISSDTLANANKITVKGSGKMSTIIRGYSRLALAGYISTTQTATVSIPNPLSPTSVPVFNLHGGIIGSENATAYLNIMDLSIIGNYEVGNYVTTIGSSEVFFIDAGYTYNGIEADNIVMSEFGNIEIKCCDKCFIGKGSLDIHIHDFTFGGNDVEQDIEQSNVGIELTRTSLMSANLIRISDGTIKCCKYIGIEFRNGNMLNITNVDFEINGMGENSVLKGSIIIRRKLNDYTSSSNYVSIINLLNCWFENTLGYAIYLEGPSEEYEDNIIVNITNCFFAESLNPNCLGVYLWLSNVLSNVDFPYISKVNIFGSSSKLPAFTILAKETITLGSYIEYFIINGTSPVISNTPTFLSERNYLLNY